MTKILAHRGFSEKYPENTMLAFKKAAEYDIAGFELDVHKTKDGVIVVTHDEAIDRVSNGTGMIVDMTYEELKDLDFRNGMDQHEFDEDTKLPTLDEFLTWLKNTKFIVNIELKSNIIRYEGMVKETVDLVKKHDLIDRVILSSFNHKDIVEAKKICPEIKCGILTWSVLNNPADYVESTRAEYYHPDFMMVDEDDLKDLKDKNIGVNPYTVNDPDDIKRLAEMGAKYIITDNPERALDALK